MRFRKAYVRPGGFLGNLTNFSMEFNMEAGIPEQNFYIIGFFSRILIEIPAFNLHYLQWKYQSFQQYKSSKYFTYYQNDRKIGFEKH